MIEDDDLQKSSVEEMLDRLVRWAETQPDISAIINQGSRARIDHPADQWSDLDLIVYTSSPERYLASTEWLKNMGIVMLTFLEKTATGHNVERRVLFQGGVDVDFSIIPKESLVKDLEDPSPQDQDLIRRGVRVLHDKTGLLSRLPEPSKKPVPTRSPPTKVEFDQLVNDFLYHIVWTAKKLRRGELWTAKACCDSYMKWKLLGMIEWHTLASKGWDTDVWFNGRFLEEWADPKIVKALGKTFAHYDYEDVKKALFATSSLFLEIAGETAQKIGYDDSILHGQEIIKLASSYLG